MLPEKVQDISKKDISGNYSKIYELEQLLKDGLITEEEFQELKRKELGLD